MDLVVLIALAFVVVYAVRDLRAGPRVAPVKPPAGLADTLKKHISSNKEVAHVRAQVASITGWMNFVLILVLAFTVAAVLARCSEHRSRSDYYYDRY